MRRKRLIQPTQTYLTISFSINWIRIWITLSESPECGRHNQSAVREFRYPRASHFAAVFTGQGDHFHPLLRAAAIALITFAELPEVEIPTVHRLRDLPLQRSGRKYH